MVPLICVRYACDSGPAAQPQYPALTRINQRCSGRDGIPVLHALGWMYRHISSSTLFMICKKDLWVEAEKALTPPGRALGNIPVL